LRCDRRRRQEQRSNQREFLLVFRWSIIDQVMRYWPLSTQTDRTAELQG
jgi:hypothetical protein